MLAGVEAGDEGGEEERRIEARVPAARRPAAERPTCAASLERPAHGDERRADGVPAVRVGVEHEP